MFWGILSAVGSDIYIFEYSKCESVTLYFLRCYSTCINKEQMTAATGTNAKEKEDKAFKLPSVRRDTRQKKMAPSKVHRTQRKRGNGT